jgi:hypothetical protein
LVVSLSVLAQYALVPASVQGVCPLMHCEMHAPPLHTLPTPHTFPHPPQFAPSVAVLAQ